MDIAKLPTIQPKDFGDLQDPERPILSLDHAVKGAHSVQGHTHPRAQILFPTRGVYRVETPLGNYVVPPTQAIWIPSHIFHHVYSNDSVDTMVFFIDQTYTRDLPDDCIVINVTPLLRELLVKAISIGNDYTSSTRQKRLIVVLMDEIGEMEAAPLRLPLAKDKRVQYIIDTLLADPANNGTLMELASQSACSERTLARLFKKETGLTFSDWRKQLRLMEAIDRIGQGHSITRVALDMGYQSTSAFTAMFRRTLGVTPSHYFSHLEK